MDHAILPPDDVPLPSPGETPSAATCPNLPARETEICPNVPSSERPNPDERAQICPDLPESAPGERENAGRKTNPNAEHAPAPALRPLSDKQLAAARWVVCGYGSKAIARQLGVNHHTVGIWTQDPRFVSLVADLRAKADASAIAMSARSNVIATGRSPRSIASTGPSSPNANRGLPPAATNKHSSGAGSGTLTERLLARIMERRETRGI